VVILIILVILYIWSIYRYFGDFRGILIKKKKKKFRGVFWLF
jgi:hypothetical protein